MRVGFSVSKRVGTAVQRNKIKRCMREAFRMSLGRVKSPVDVVFIARADLVPLVEEQGTMGVEAKMRDLLQKAGLLATVEDQRP